MTKKFEFNWQIPVPDILLTGGVFDRWTEEKDNTELELACTFKVDEYGFFIYWKSEGRVSWFFLYFFYTSHFWICCRWFTRGFRSLFFHIYYRLYIVLSFTELTRAQIDLKLYQNCVRRSLFSVGFNFILSVCLSHLCKQFILPTYIIFWHSHNIEKLIL